MFEYVRCSCGRPLGALSVLYMAEKRALIEHQFGPMGESAPDPDYVMTAIIPVETGEIMDNLQLMLDCCRGRTMSQLTYNEVY